MHVISLSLVCMNKIIKVNEYGSHEESTIVSDKIVDLDTLTYPDGSKVTIIKLINGDVLHVTETQEQIQKQLV